MAHLRRIGARTFDQPITAIGQICYFFTQDECWNYLIAAAHALGFVDNRIHIDWISWFELPFEEIWMRPERFVITDRSWRAIEPLLPGMHRSRGVTGKDNRLFLEAVLWKVRAGGQWHDHLRSPEGERRQGGPQHQAVGRSKGGLTTKVLAIADALGTPVRFKLLPGQRSDIVGVYDLIDGIDFDALLADKAFDIDHLRGELNDKNAEAVIPAKRNRIKPVPHDKEAYK